MGGVYLITKPHKTGKAQPEPIDYTRQHNIEYSCKGYKCKPFKRKLSYMQISSAFNQRLCAAEECIFIAGWSIHTIVWRIDKALHS